MRARAHTAARSLAGMEHAPLRTALGRLAEADRLLVQGLPPDADYRFKHALIQAEKPDGLDYARPRARGNGATLVAVSFTTLTSRARVRNH